MVHVYILKSEKWEKTYVGITGDPDRRLKEHNSGYGNFSKKYMPWRLVYSEEYANIKDARAREKYLKSAAGRRFIKMNKIIPR